MNELSSAEREFCFYKVGTAGSFGTRLYECYFAADHINGAKLINAFPQLEVARRYSQEPGYWEDLQKRFKKATNMSV
jgi:hypothetical protein